MSSQTKPKTNEFTGLPQRKSPTAISVLIVGAGVGGLMSALECWRQGHSVHIIEKSSQALETGDFFTIGHSALKALRHWPDLAKASDELAYDPWIKYRKHDGTVLLGPQPFKFQAPPGETAPTRIHRHHRPKFQRILLDGIQRLGLHVEFGCKVVEYFEEEENNIAGVVLADGSRLTADVLIAADGVGTKSWHLVAGGSERTRSSGYSIFRTAYPVEHAIKDGVVEKGFPMLENGVSTMEMWYGPDIHAAFWRGPDIFTWTLTHKDEGTGQESWNHHVDSADAIKALESVPGWPEIAKRAIRTTPNDSLVDWTLMWRDPQPKWTSPGGRVVQLGDSAHTFLPSSGNGATQAMEDAVSLAACLQIAGKDQVPQATRVHNKLRFERVACCQLLGFINQEKYHHTDWEAVAKRPQAAQPSYGRWIWQSEPEKYAVENYHKALDHIVNGAVFENTNVPPGFVYKPWSIDDLAAQRKNGRPIEVSGDWS